MYYLSTGCETLEVGELTIDAVDGGVGIDGLVHAPSFDDRGPPSVQPQFSRPKRGEQRLFRPTGWWDVWIGACEHVFHGGIHGGIHGVHDIEVAAFYVGFS